MNTLRNRFVILKPILPVIVLMTTLNALALDPSQVEQGSQFKIEQIDANTVKITNMSNKDLLVFGEFYYVNIDRFSSAVFGNEIAVSSAAHQAIIEVTRDDRSLDILALRKLTDVEILSLAKYTGNKIRERYRALLAR
jgi:hypothetical protein